MLAAASSVGPHAVAAHALRALSAKQKTAWRPILVRLQVLTDIINTYGLGPSAGVSAETAMNFCKTYGAFAHSNGEVRDGARDLTVAVYKHVGAGPLDLYIQVRQDLIDGWLHCYLLQPYSPLPFFVMFSCA